MRYLVLLLLLTGCGQERFSKADFKAWHPWSRDIVVMEATPENGMTETIIYLDRIPRMDFNSSAVEYEAGYHTVLYDKDGMSIARRWVRSTAFVE